MEKRFIKRDTSLSMLLIHYFLTLNVLLAVTLGAFFLYVITYYSSGKGRIARATQDEAYAWAESTAETGYFDKETVPDHLDVIILDESGAEIYSHYIPSYAESLRAFMEACRNSEDPDWPAGRQVYREWVKTHETAYIHYSLIADNETLFLIILIVICILDLLIPTVLCVHKIRKSIRVVSAYAREIRSENLDILPPKSGIREMNEIIRAVDFMKVNLTKSMEDKWADEQSRINEKTQIAHDLKTPLTIIRGNADLLLEKNTSPEDRETIEAIIETSERIARSILEILE